MACVTGDLPHNLADGLHAALADATLAQEPLATEPGHPRAPGSRISRPGGFPSPLAAPNRPPRAGAKRPRGGGRSCRTGRARRRLSDLWSANRYAG
jgi:hypothetical protein